MTRKSVVSVGSDDNVIKELKTTTQIKDTDNTCKLNREVIGTDPNYKHKWVWQNVVFYASIHCFALYGIWLGLGQAKMVTILFGAFAAYAASEGITIGAHRMYSHKAFKAKPILRAILIILQTMAGQNSVFIWCRDHRLHHRYSDTDADPHNSKRGFFFCHMGWLMTKKHPYVIKLGRKLDMSDLEADWMVMFQKRYYYYLYIIFSILIPVWIPVRFFGESWWNSLFICYFARWVFGLNGIWLVNSAAHLYGTRPYDKSLRPVESLFVSFISLGEGWHNYHHAFPWDYKAAEWDMHFNFTASIIRFLEKIGWAYDLKTVPTDVIINRIHRKGDGTHFILGVEASGNCVRRSASSKPQL